MSSIPLIILSYLLNKQIYFKCIQSERKNVFLKKVLSFTNGVRLNYNGKSGSLYTSYLDIFNSVVNEYFEKKIKNDNVYRFIKENWAGIEEGIIENITKSSLFNNAHFGHGISSVPLIESINQYQGLVIYPSTNNGYILLKEKYTENAKHKVSHSNINLYCVFQFLQLLARKFFILFAVKKNTALVKNKSIKSVRRARSESKVLYFPHSNMKYGVFFKKNYIFDKDVNSILNVKNICMLFFSSDLDDLSKRYFRMWGINYFYFFSLPHSINKFIFFAKVLTVLKLKVFSNPYLSYELLLLFYKVQLSSQRLKVFKDAKIAYIHYDALFPQYLSLALKINGVETIALQERMIQYQYYPNHYFDNYFISGSSVKTYLKYYGYSIKRHYSVGLPRTEYIRNVSCKSEVIKSKNRRIVLCFGIFPLGDDSVALYGDAGTSYASNIEYLNTIKWLANELPNCYFYVRFKDTAFLDEVRIKEVIKEILRLDNIYIDKNLAEHSSYQLIREADVVIGKTSMVIEEARASGKPSFYYDPEKYYENLNNPIKELNVIASNKQELKRMIVNPDAYFNPMIEKDVCDSIYSTNIQPSHENIRNKIIEIYNKNKSID